MKKFKATNLGSPELVFLFTAESLASAKQWAINNLAGNHTWRIRYAR